VGSVTERYDAVMSETSPAPIEIPPLPAERLEAIRQSTERINAGDLSDLLPWDEVAHDLGLPAR